MKHISRSLLQVLLALPLAFLFTPSAEAQTCDQCTPFSNCSDSCTVCRREGVDGCVLTAASTCGNESGACMQCTPAFVEVSREVRGTYGNGSMFSCSHHKVEWVTRHDNNQCNTDPAYWNVSTCEDTLDLPGKEGWFPDCCDGYAPGGAADSRYTCNHVHNC